MADLRDIASKAGDLDRSFVEVDPIIRDLKERGDSGRELPPTAPVRSEQSVITERDTKSPP